MSANITIHVSNKEWNYQGTWVGGKFSAPNFSGGYHGILQQWWEYYGKDKFDWLLISENNVVKQCFKDAYPDVNFETLDYYDNLGKEVDLVLNLCDSAIIKNTKTYDIIVCQATFEHLYDPVTALKNLSSMLNPGGSVLIHTHVPGMKYHPYPKDYLRFYPDWFIDAQEFINGIILKELVVVSQHIFAVYQKV
jgi:SAM-dependent methyltransferase